LSELLVETNLCTSQRSASAKIKAGKVRVAGLLVGNVDALLVITAPTVLECEGKCLTLMPRGFQKP
jgi:predicted rRNA methylase YqxC with S4 and FtsJ domains